MKNKLQSILAECSGRTIVVASKYADPSTIKALYAQGFHTFGENRVDSFLEKYDMLRDYAIHWHFIGTLQSKKVVKMINKIECLHALDNIKLARYIEHYRRDPLNCFIQVNITQEETKHGLRVEEVLPFLKEIASFKKINIIGLMTMARAHDTEEQIRHVFLALKELLNRVQLEYPMIQSLSMGMSDDYEIALECGATHLRLGRILFEEKE